MGNKVSEKPGPAASATNGGAEGQAFGGIGLP
nr:MAG TPA: hypothetical protein [Caudoviricetes sp.]